MWKNVCNKEFGVEFWLKYMYVIKYILCKLKKDLL